MSEQGRAYIPVDLRGAKKLEKSILVGIDDDAEPKCVSMQLYTDTLNIDIRLDESALDALFDHLLKMRLQLARDLSFQKGAAHASRRKGRP
jgi:hypothetical protein